MMLSILFGYTSDDSCRRFTAVVADGTMTTVAGIPVDQHEAIVEHTHPRFRQDCLVVDTTAANKKCVELIAAIREKKHRLPIVVLGYGEDSAFETELLKAGADAYLVKNSNKGFDRALFAAVLDSVRRGRAFGWTDALARMATTAS